MKIIQRLPNPSGAYPPPQTWGEEPLPEGCTIIPDNVDLADFYSYNGFVTLEIEGNIVTGYTPNTEAWEEWKATLPMPEEPPLDDITALRLAVAELAEVQAEDTLATQLAIAELAEALLGGE